MRELDIAMAMINQVDLYHLQRRNGDKSIGAAGLIGCFGGKINSTEAAREAISRELQEETNLSIRPDGLRQLEEFDVESDHQHEPVKVHVRVFEVLLQHGVPVTAKEGELVSWTAAEIKANQEELTPATKEFFKRYL